MNRRLSLLVLFSVLALGLASCKSTSDQTAPPQDGSSPQTSQNSNVSKGETTEAPEAAKPEAKTTDSGHYRINAGQCQVTVQVFAGGLFASLGHDHTVSLRDVTGDVQLTPGAIEPVSLGMKIKTGSATEAGKEFSDEERQEIDHSIRVEALEASKYPEITFKSTNIKVSKAGQGQYQARIAGELTLHGVTHPIVISAQVTLSGNSLRARGEFPLRHSDYQIKRLSAGGGLVKAKEEMKLSFEIAADRE